MEVGTIAAAEASTGSRTMADLALAAGEKFSDRPALRLLQGGKEEGLVDPPLEYRHTELHALGDHFPPLHPRLTGQLGGGQMDRHVLPPVRLPGATGDFIDRGRRRNRFSGNWAD